MNRPSKTAEAVAALLLPPACREEVLGDLHERYHSPTQYWVDVLTTVPMVVISRIRRTSDSRVFFAHSCVWCLSFAAAAWWQADLRLARIAVPALAALLGIALGTAYAVPGKRSVLALSRGPLIGAVLAWLSQNWLPGWLAASACAMAFLLSSAVSMIFASPERRAVWGKRWTLMNLTIIALAMVCAFLLGVGIGVIFVPPHPDLAHVFHNSIPFLVLCTAWLAAMIFKLRAAQKK